MNGPRCPTCGRCVKEASTVGRVTIVAFRSPRVRRRDAAAVAALSAVTRHLTEIRRQVGRVIPGGGLLPKWPDHEGWREDLLGLRIPGAPSPVGASGAWTLILVTHWKRRALATVDYVLAPVSDDTFIEFVATVARVDVRVHLGRRGG